MAQINDLDNFKVILDYFNYLISRLKMIGLITLSCFVLGVIYYLITPNEYTSYSTLLPEVDESSTSSSLLKEFGGLAGINIPSGTPTNLSPELYPKVLKTYQFYRSILDTEFYFLKIEEQKTLQKYLEEDYNPGILAKSIGIIFLLKDTFFSGRYAEQYQPLSDSLIFLTKNEVKTFEIIADRIAINLDDLGVINLEVKLQDPYAAAMINQFIVNYLTDYAKSIQSEKDRQNLVFLESQVESSKSNYELSQNNLLAFREKNTSISSPSLVAEEEHLKNAYDLNYSVYKTFLQQKTQAEIQIQKNISILHVIEAPKVYLEKSEPKIVFTLIFFIFLGIALSLTYHSIIFFKPIIFTKI